jgi:protein SCO1
MSNTKQHRTLVFGLIVVALFAFSVGFVVRHYQNKITVKAATLLEKPRPINAFKLVDNRNHAFNKQDLKGHWTFMFFGFTDCPSICPPTMHELATMRKALQAKHIKVMPQVLMVSINPVRDTAKRLDTYVKVYDPTFIGLTGSEKQIKALSKELGIAVLRTNMPNKHVALDHSGTVLLINPRGQVRAFFSMPHKAPVLASDYLAITRQG